jgi:hypothetical protein
LSEKISFWFGQALANAISGKSIISEGRITAMFEYRIDLLVEGFNRELLFGDIKQFMGETKTSLTAHRHRLSTNIW